MVVMNRPENADGKIQGYSLPEIRDGLKIVSMRLARFVDRGPGRRKLEYGIALSRLAAWFLVQDVETQKRIIQQGNAIIDDLRTLDEGQPPLDGEFADEVRARHPGAVLGRWLQSSNVPVGPVADDAGSGKGSGKVGRKK